MKTLWIRIEKREEVKEAQDFILHVLAEEGLTGEVPVKLCTEQQSVVPLSHIYDVSEDALVSLYEKYGERNVKLTEAGLMPESWSSRTADPLEYIADALENISGALESISQTLGEREDCIVSTSRGSFLRIGGSVDSCGR